MYTTQGLMTAADYTEHLKDTDQGTTRIMLDDVPAWFVEPATGRCPVCDTSMTLHEAVTVQDASGEIVDCATFEED